MHKSEIRRQVLAQRRSLTAAQRATFSQNLEQRLFALPEWKEAKVIGAYASLPDEVSTQKILRRVLEQGRVLVLPRIEQGQDRLTFIHCAQLAMLVPGPLNILQPPEGPAFPPAEIDLLLVPGVAFDLSGNRLGYGRGYYDRFLAGFVGVRIGLAYDLQVVARLPRGTWDQPVQMLVTESRTLHF